MSQPMNENTSKQNENSMHKQNSAFNGKPDGLSRDLQDFNKSAGVLATDAAHMIKDNASKYYEQGMDQAKKLGKRIESRIQDKPLQSLMVVAGAGLILGRLWSRR